MTYKEVKRNGEFSVHYRRGSGRAVADRFLMHVGGGLIHIILVIAVIVFLFQFLTGRRSV